MESKCRLRLASSLDVGGILPLFRAYQQHYSQLTGADEQKTRNFLTDLVDQGEQGFAIIAEIDGSVVGFSTGYVTVSGVLAERLIHLGDLYVEPAFRRRGIATALVNAVSAQARMRGIGLVRWLSLASNTGLNRWYESLGATSGDFCLFLLPTDPGQTGRQD